MLSQQINIKLNKKRLHEIFFIRDNPFIWVGIRKKIFSSKNSKYSEVSEEMVLGILVKEYNLNSFNIFTYIKKSKSSIKDLFNKIDYSCSIDLYFPDPPLNNNDETFIVNDHYWQNIASSSKSLDKDEEHFRIFSIKALKKYILPNTVVYDPACSSGIFLSHISKNYPLCKCIGSDKSIKMINIAKNKIKHVFLNDANNLKTENLHCDVIICRFLNHEVITEEIAIKIMNKLLLILNSKGIIVIFGHTPVTFDVLKFADDKGLKVLNSIGKLYKNNIFQYYIIMKKD